ncbi:hypothetical protein Peur_030346 [Populus x canadensis]
MGVLSFCFFVFWVSRVVFAQQTTDPNEVDALNRLIDYWNLRDKLNITNDPCIQNAAWANKQANPRVACDCSNNTCHITHLDFGKNVLNGAIPAEIERLSNMQYLYINSSGVSGRIPQEFANLKSLQTLWASDNLFTGKLPDFFGTLTKLRNLRLQGTLLEGPIPSTFRALKKLGDLRIGDLNGEDSSLEFLLDQKKLTILILRNCLLSGQIPDQLGNFSQLQELDLSFNNLTGQIPDSFQDLASLQYLYLGSNNLNGQLPANIIGPNLIAIDVSFNPLSGNLPQNSMRVGLSMNAVGTSINANNLQGKASGMLQCLKADFNCSNKVPSKTFSVKCGGTDKTSASGIEYEGDFESMGAASLYTSSDNLWAVSNTGNFISNPNGPQYLTQTVSNGAGSSKRDKKRVGKLVGISMACVAGLVIISSVFYLWWIKEDSSQHMRIYTGHPVTKDLPTSECSNPSITGNPPKVIKEKEASSGCFSVL